MPVPEQLRAQHVRSRIGDSYPALAQHLYAVITLMRVSRSWDQFKAFLDDAHPVRSDTLQLPLMLEPPLPATLTNRPDATASLPLFEQSPDADPPTIV